MTKLFEQGMIYLHESTAHYHGALSNHNCLIDNRFVLKIAYYRLDFLPRVVPDLFGPNGDYRWFLTYSPEQLRATGSNKFKGSRESDIYSYAYVIAEIICGLAPFEQEMGGKMSVKGTVGVEIYGHLFLEHKELLALTLPQSWWHDLFPCNCNFAGSCRLKNTA